ncbi:DUF1990 family protein [Rubripirellula reticaptiva]|uniref:DUF1990 domain-containing protein n=1 Tax=Rubripirellula reticaptiva TaxID=2528013 RepID=A0A5C6EDM9_9BACT|nr:DUF1990 family protein [Rubripirellula reticaptiva]TWU46534.1 hypothetical protein Poly59_55070 [Rubripirellula reticaptiva]
MKSEPWWTEQLTQLHALSYNYDASEYVAGEPGWSVDHYECNVPSELPGPPQPDGSFETAKRILIAYKFPDPGRIVGYYDETADLAGRTMLLEAKFLWMRFIFGVRVSNVIDEESPNGSGELVTRYGYAYRTLEGHWEIGEMTYVVEKCATTGEVRILIDAYSKFDRIPNWFHRLGFKLLGRSVQKQFAKSCLQRLREMVVAELDSSP